MGTAAAGSRLKIPTSAEKLTKFCRDLSHRLEVAPHQPTLSAVRPVARFFMPVVTQTETTITLPTAQKVTVTK